MTDVYLLPGNPHVRVTPNLVSDGGTVLLEADTGGRILVQVSAVIGTMNPVTFDANNNGIVDNSEALEGHPASYFTDYTDTAVAGFTETDPIFAAALDTDPALSADSDEKVASQKAVKQYIADNAGVGTVTRSGATTEGHLAVWNGTDADSIKDGGEVPTASIELTGLVFGEDHSDECTGAETEFLTDYTFKANTLRVFLNGLLQRGGGDDYTAKIARTGFDYVVAPFSGDALIMHYIKDVATGAVTVTGPYTDGYGALATTLVTTLHMHSSNSVGTLSPADLATALEATGYGVLVITDDDQVTADPGGHSMTYLPASELKPSTGHVLSINSDYTRGSVTDRQTLISAVIADGGLAFLAHPRWTTGWSQSVMSSLTGYHGIEIFNQTVESGAAGSNGITYPGFDLEDWDFLLANVRRNIWGIATDDLHEMSDWKYYHLGYLRIFTNSTSAADIATSLENGNFVAEVANYGVTPGKPSVSSAGVTVHIGGATSVRFIGDTGVLLEEDTGEDGDYTFNGTEKYVRIEAVGDYTEPFSSALPFPWSDVDGTWTVGGGILQQTNTTATSYRTILRRHREGSFQAQMDVRFPATSQNAGALMFNVLDTYRYYIMRLGTVATGSVYSNSLTIAKTTNNSFGTPLGDYDFTPSSATWYTIKLDYLAGRIRAKVWETGGTEPDWQLDVTDTTWTHGSFGLRATKDCDFDNLYINGFKTYYQPIPRGDWE
jgi:hypothetical protein